MSRLPFGPTPLSSQDFETYTQRWKDLITAAADVHNADARKMLQECFTSSNGAAINYAYLDDAVIAPLLMNAVPGEDLIKAKFVLIGETLEDSVFSIVLYHTRADGSYVPDAKNPHYYLAGVADKPAPLGIAATQPTAAAPGTIPPGCVPTTTAEEWIKNWNNLGVNNITAQLFEASSHEIDPVFDTHLHGYTFRVTDFTNPWPQFRTMYDALWLNFDLKPQQEGNPDSAQVFSTIVDYNKTPNCPEPGVLVLQKQVGQDAFYDISKPCPPYTC